MTGRSIAIAFLAAVPAALLASGLTALWLSPERPASSSGPETARAPSPPASAAKGIVGEEPLSPNALEAVFDATADLAVRVDALEDVLEELEARSTAQQTEGGQEQGDPEEDTDRSRAPGFDEEALAEAGLPAARIEEMQEAWQRLELARQETHEQAMREGYYFSKRHRRELDALREESIAELGEQGYADMQYAAGRGNRPIVANIVPGSPAARSGLQPGDVLLRYDGVAVFRPRDVLMLAASGPREERIDLNVLRDGRRVRIELPRSTVGMVLKPHREPPR